MKENEKEESIVKADVEWSSSSSLTSIAQHCMQTSCSKESERERVKTELVMEIYQTIYVRFAYNEEEWLQDDQNVYETVLLYASRKPNVILK